MASRVAFLGTSGGVSFAAAGFDQALAEIGENTGNALFQYALWDLIKNPKFCIGSSTLDAIVENADVLVIPAANQVNPSWDMGGWAELIERANLPCAVIGLGAQTKIGGSAHFELLPGTVRFLKAASERAVRIGVRGQFTQDVLERFGVTNTVVVGCPSRTINRSISGSSIAARLSALAGHENIRVGYLYGTFEEEARDAEHKLSSMLVNLPHDIIAQTDSKIMRLIYDGTVLDRNYLAWFGQIARPDLTGDKYIEYLGTRGRFFSDARTWIDQMAKYDLVIGMRIHGAVAGIMAGVAAICVAFDSRTLELAETMGVPYVLHKDVEQAENLQQLLTQVRFSASRFDDLQRTCIAEIESILTDTGCVVRELGP